MGRMLHGQHFVEFTILHDMDMMDGVLLGVSRFDMKQLHQVSNGRCSVQWCRNKHRQSLKHQTAVRVGVGPDTVAWPGMMELWGGPCIDGPQADDRVVGLLLDM